MSTELNAKTEELIAILHRNFNALGWKIDTTNCVDPEYNFFRFQLTCPCGGVEYASLETDLRDEDDMRALAKHILSSTASIRHLKKDVERGVLPPHDVERFAFKGELVE